MTDRSASLEQRDEHAPRADAPAPAPGVAGIGRGRLRKSNARILRFQPACPARWISYGSGCSIPIATLNSFLLIATG